MNGNENLAEGEENNLNSDGESHARILSARRFLAFAAVAHLVVFFLPIYDGDGLIGGAVFLASLFVLVVAAGRLSQAVGDSWLMTIIGVVLVLLIPLVGLISVLVLLARTNRKLKQTRNLDSAAK